MNMANIGSIMRWLKFFCHIFPSIFLALFCSKLTHCGSMYLYSLPLETETLHDDHPSWQSCVFMILRPLLNVKDIVQILPLYFFSLFLWYLVFCLLSNYFIADFLLCLIDRRVFSVCFLRISQRKKRCKYIEVGSMYLHFFVS